MPQIPQLISLRLCRPHVRRAGALTATNPELSHCGHALNQAGATKRTGQQRHRRRATIGRGAGVAGRGAISGDVGGLSECRAFRVTVGKAGVVGGGGVHFWGASLAGQQKAPCCVLVNATP